MAFDFPSSPALDQEFAPSGGPTYKWNGYAWAKKSSSIGGVIIADMPPVADPGTLFWEDDTGQLFIRYNDGNSTQWVQVAAPGIPDSVQDGVIYARRNGLWVQPPLSFRNKVINGTSEINQRGVGAVQLNGLFAHDRWKLNKSAATGVATWGHGENWSVSAVGNYNAFFQTTTAQASLAAAEFVFASQPIEGWMLNDLRLGRADAKPFTVSFRANCSPSPMVMSVVFRNADATQSYATPITIDTTPRAYSVTIPGPTSGTWLYDNRIGLQLLFAFACGTTFAAPTPNQWLAGNYVAATGQTNGLAAVNNAFSIADVQLEAGTVATPFEKRDLTSELIRCKRYYQQFQGLVIENSQISVSTTYPVQMRAVPSITSNGAGFAIAVNHDTDAHWYQTTRGYSNVFLNAEL